MAPADLAADTEPAPAGPGRYRLDVPDRWSFVLPSGGVLMTAALRAAERELADPGLRLGSATATFCAPVRPGPVELAVHVLRRGGATAQVRVGARPAGPPAAADDAADAAGYEVVATFTRDRAGPDLVGARMPDVPGPDASPPVVDDHPRNPHPKARFFAQVDCRMARGARVWLPGWDAGPARQARWFRYLVPQRDAAGRLDRLALPPLADTLPGALTQALGPGAYRFYAPSADLTLHVVDDTEREWILVSAFARRARAGWAIAEAELWDDAGRLVAFATQLMYVSSLAGTPPVVDASGRP